jgi:FkbM family methyltransferase
MNRIFIDVGAHNGETLHVALNPIFGFTSVYSLEPSKICLDYLYRFTDPRLIILPFGLSNKSGNAILHGSGLLGGSLYSDKRQITANEKMLINEEISLLQASEFINGLSFVDAKTEIFLKLNCEGSECDILDDLILNENINKISSIYVDFDVRKIKSQSYRQAIIENQLTSLNVKYHTPDSLSAKGNQGVKKWLLQDCQTISPNLASNLKFILRCYSPIDETIRIVLEAILPRKFYLWLGHKIGRQSRRNYFH